MGRHRHLALTVGVAALAGIVVASAALVLRDGGSGDDRPAELRIPVSQLALDEPRAFHVDGLGTSPYGDPYPLWIVRDAAGLHALIGKDPHSGCAVPYLADYDTSQFPGSDANHPMGGFKDGCGGWVYTRDGDVIFGAPYRGLDSFPASLEGDIVVVSLAHVIVGRCRTPAFAEHPPVGCSEEGRKVTRRTVPPAVIPNWGHR